MHRSSPTLPKPRKEVDDIRKQYGDTPVTYLNKIGFSK